MKFWEVLKAFRKIWLCPLKQELGFAAWDRTSEGDVFLGWVKEYDPDWLSKLIEEEQNDLD